MCFKSLFKSHSMAFGVRPVTLSMQHKYFTMQNTCALLCVGSVPCRSVFPLQCDNNLKMFARRFGKPPYRLFRGMSEGVFHWHERVKAMAVCAPPTCVRRTTTFFSLFSCEHTNAHIMNELCMKIHDRKTHDRRTQTPARDFEYR